MKAKRRQHELLPFLVIWADQYKRDMGLNGVHPVHHALMAKYGAPMERFPIATNDAGPSKADLLPGARRVK